MPGPPPKPDSERIRRNKPDIEPSEVNMIGSVSAPDLDIEDPHPMVSDFYDSLRESGQAKYYEPSDWQYARVTMTVLDSLLKSPKMSPTMVMAILPMFNQLLVTAAERRRVHLEISRDQGEQEVKNASDFFREQLSRPS